MGREIKFRAWHTKEKAMLFVGDAFGTTHPLHCAAYAIQSQPVELTQCTGLKDRNGREIYEGDVVKCHYFYEALGDNLGVYEAEKEIIGEIAFQEMGLWIQCNSEEDSGYLLWITGLHEESFEVIGNIYENPELKGE